MKTWIRFFWAVIASSGLGSRAVACLANEDAGWLVGAGDDDIPSLGNMVQETWTVAERDCAEAGIEPNTSAPNTSAKKKIIFFVRLHWIMVHGVLRHRQPNRPVC